MAVAVALTLASSSFAVAELISRCTSCDRLDLVVILCDVFVFVLLFVVELAAAACLCCCLVELLFEHVLDETSSVDFIEFVVPVRSLSDI